MTADTLIKCKACGQDISPEARVCIHCGQPLKKRNYRSVIIKSVITVGLIVIVFLFANTIRIAGRLPSCDSANGQSDAKRAIENSPFGKTYRLTIITVSDITTVLDTPDKVECKAMVVLNSAKKGTINYNFTWDSSGGAGRYLIRAELDTGSFKPIP